ncbi:unnamed protein product [Mortierella alpina]
MNVLPGLSDLQLELLLTPSTLDSKIPFLHYLPILQELLQLVQQFQKQWHTQLLAINPHIAFPSQVTEPTPRLRINSKIEKLLSLSMALAWRFCTITLVLLPGLPSYRASFHEAVLRPFKREAAQYLARIQTYYKLGSLRYLEADLALTFNDPQPPPQPQALLLTGDSTEDSVKKEASPPVSCGELMQAANRKPSQPAPVSASDTQLISNRATTTPAATSQLHQIDASKAFSSTDSRTTLSALPAVANPAPAHESLRHVQPAPQHSPSASYEHLDRTRNGRLIAAKERAILSLPLPAVSYTHTATSLALSGPTAITSSARPSLSSLSPPLPHPPRRLTLQEAPRLLPAVVITAPTPSIPPSTTEVSTTSTRCSTRSLADGPTPSTNTSPARLPLSPTRTLMQRRVSVQSLIQRFEHSVPSAETYRMAAKYRDRRMSLPHLQRALEKAETSALTPRRSHPDAPSSGSSRLRLNETAAEAAAAAPLASASTSEAILPYHLRDPLSRKRSTRDHIRSLPAYQLSRIEDKKHRLSITPSSLSSSSSSFVSSSSFSHTTMPSSSSLASIRLHQATGSILSTDRGNMSSEEERNLNKLAETVDRGVARIVDRVESDLSLSRIRRVDYLDRSTAPCSTLGAVSGFKPITGSSTPQMAESDALVIARTAHVSTATQEVVPRHHRIVSDDNSDNNNSSANNANNALSRVPVRHLPFNDPGRTTAQTLSQKNAASSSQGKIKSLISVMNRRPPLSQTGSERSDAVVLSATNSLQLLSGPVSPSTLLPPAENQLAWPRRQESQRSRSMSLSTTCGQVRLRTPSSGSASIDQQPRNGDDTGEIFSNDHEDVQGSHGTSSGHVELIRVPTQSSSVSSWSSRFAPKPAPLCLSGLVTSTAQAASSTHSGHGHDGDTYSEGALQYLELYSPKPRVESDNVSSERQEPAICTEMSPARGSGARERRHTVTDASSMTASSSRSSCSSSLMNTVVRSNSQHLSNASDEIRVARSLSWSGSDEVPAFTKPFKPVPQSSDEVRSLWSSPSIASTRSTSSLRLAFPGAAAQWNPRPPQKSFQS